MISLKKIIASNYFLFFIGIVFGIYLALAVLSYYTTAEVLRDPPSQGIYKTYSFTHDDLTRTYDVYIPSSLKNDAPAFFAFHGSRGSAEGMRVFTGYDFEYLAEEKGFLVVYPQGYKNHWNDCRSKADYKAKKLDIDDVGYFKQVVKYIKTDFKINTNRIVVSGISNGGHMVFKLAHEAPGDSLLYAVFAANLPIEENNDCNRLNSEVNMLIFNGSLDPINPHEGGLVSILGNDTRGYVISSNDTYKYWKDLTSSSEEIIFKFPELDGDKKTAVIKKYSNGTKFVALYTLINGGHIYSSPNVKNPIFTGKSARDINTADEVFAVYKRIIHD